MNTSSQVYIPLQMCTAHVHAFPYSGAGIHLACLIFSTINTLENHFHVPCMQQVCDADLEEHP